MLTGRRIESTWCVNLAVPGTLVQGSEEEEEGEEEEGGGAKFRRQQEE